MNKDFQFPNDLDEVDGVVSDLKAEVESTLSFEALVRFEICLSEALANLAIHAKGSDRDGENDISLVILDGFVDVKIMDPEGTQPFNILDHAKKLSEIDRMDEAGRGLGLIIECSDNVKYEELEDRNRLSLSFKNRPDG